MANIYQLFKSYFILNSQISSKEKIDKLILMQILILIRNY